MFRHIGFRDSGSGPNEHGRRDHTFGTRSHVVPACFSVRRSECPTNPKAMPASMFKPSSPKATTWTVIIIRIRVVVIGIRRISNNNNNKYSKLDCSEDGSTESDLDSWAREALIEDKALSTTLTLTPQVPTI